ncbi:UDP-N-acetylmuramate--L-alanine ligase [compost metagenome]
MADNLLLMEIYPARELPIEGINSSWLLDKITAEKKQLVTAEEVLEFARDEKPELIVTVGAGDIDKLVKPLQTILEHA